ncbi:MAG TPA: hypothetical protein VEI02_10770, partial [Planctomycetota bacterium]|nr:hypothetical protein [Planctomycetota bacterium]
MSDAAWSPWLARCGTRALAVIGWMLGATHALVCLKIPGRFAWPAVIGASILAWIAARAVKARAEAPTTPSPSAPTGGRRALAELAPLVAAAIGLAAPLSDAMRTAVYAHDALYIWTPATAIAMDEAPPRLHAVLKPGEVRVHYHPEYVRGLPLLNALLSAPFDAVDTRPHRLAPFLLCLLGLLAGFDATARRGNLLGAFFGALLVGLIQLFARHASSGYADAALASFFVAACGALAPDARGRSRPWIAMGAALGAAVTKDEGAIVFLLVALVAAARAVPDRSPAGLFAIAAAASVFAPWKLVRKEQHLLVSEPMALLRHLPENAGLAWLRFERTLAEFGHLGFGTPDPSPGGGLFWQTPGGDSVWWAAAAALV